MSGAPRRKQSNIWKSGSRLSSTICDCFDVCWLHTTTVAFPVPALFFRYRPVNHAGEEAHLPLRRPRISPSVNPISVMGTCKQNNDEQALKLVNLSELLFCCYFALMLT